MYASCQQKSLKERLPMKTMHTVHPLYNYDNRIFVHENNAVVNAKELDALDARELYPDYQPPGAKTAARRFYKGLPRVDYGF